MVDDDSYAVFNTGLPEEDLPEPVISLIGELIKRDNVQSVSCPFNNSTVWRLLVAEQVRRAGKTGNPLQHELALAGPDSGFSFDPTEWGGEVHIPYEGACMGDLFVVPQWRKLYPDWREQFPNAGAGKGDKATLGDYAHYWADPEKGYSCHYLLSQCDMGELSCAHRRVVGNGWILYESSKPYVKVNMLGWL